MNYPRKDDSDDSPSLNVFPDTCALSQQTKKRQITEITSLNYCFIVTLTYDSVDRLKKQSKRESVLTINNALLFEHSRHESRSINIIQDRNPGKQKCSQKIIFL